MFRKVVAQGWIWGCCPGPREARSEGCSHSAFLLQREGFPWSGWPGCLLPVICPKLRTFAQFSRMGGWEGSGSSRPRECLFRNNWILCLCRYGIFQDPLPALPGLVTPARRDTSFLMSTMRNLSQKDDGSCFSLPPSLLQHGLRVALLACLQNPSGLANVCGGARIQRLLHHFEEAAVKKQKRKINRDRRPFEHHPLSATLCWYFTFIISFHSFFGGAFFWASPSSYGGS